MITIYYSNRLECLKKILIKLISTYTLDTPLYPEIILSENIAMMEWLYIKLSEHFSVSANIKFFSSFDFIWNILTKSLWGILPSEEISYSKISWILMQILLDINNDRIHNFSIIKKYLHDDVKNYKCLQLSEQIKNLFIRYFIYHPDWLLQWQRGKFVKELDMYTQSWQSELWRLFLKEINKHQSQTPLFYFNSIYEYIVNFLGKTNISCKNKLPKRIFVYGVSYFPPILLEILQALGKYINIYILCINPCRFFLKENLNYNNIISIIRERSQLFQCFSKTRSWNIFNRKCLLLGQDKTIYNDIGNFLLSSWGKRFQEIFYSLLALEITCENSTFIENINNVSLLHMLQNDILNDYSEKFPSIITVSSVKNFEINIKNRLLCSNDNSLSVHICHNIQREIEVLHDRLLSIISDDPSLLPHEIIVMASNIDYYSSIIRAVFNSSSMYGRHLPYTIFDSSVTNINMITSSFLKLLNLSYIRFSTEEILELLSVPALALRFNIDKDGVKLLNTWILESGICWGLDDDDVCSDIAMCPNSNAQYTWKFGITRMLLSYAINSSSGTWNDILSYNVGDSTSFMELVGYFSYFLVKLKYWRNQILKVHVLKEWLFLAEEIINDFYIIDYDLETKSTLLELKNYWRKIIISGIQANYYYPVSINILYSKLCDKLNTKKVKHRFCFSGIIFCNLSSARSIPFKVVCLLGMNINVCPMSNKAPVNFDLMKDEVRSDDCHAWCNDRYLFLEALLSAKEKFYISLIGDSIHDHIKYVSSILVNELFEYIIYNFLYVEIGNTKKISSITIDWIYHNLCFWHTRVPFSLKNFTSESKNQSFFKEWLLTGSRKNDLSGRRFLCSLPARPIDIISLDSLCNFYLHPIRAWFQNRLKIYIPKILEFPADEPFSLETRVKYHICRDLISAFLDKNDINVLYKKYCCSGVLPYGNFGNICWVQQYEKMMKLSEMISVYYLPMDRFNLRCSLTFNNNIQLHGVLYEVQKNGLLRWKPGILSMRDGLLLWLEHLVYCALGGEGDSWMFGINSSWHFIALPYTEAKEYLLYLIFGYSHGLTTPLLLLSHSGGFWLRHCFNVKQKSLSLDLNCQLEARRKLIIAWEGNQYIYGDSTDPYVSRLIPKLQDQDVESIITAAKKYFLLFMKYNV